MASGSKSGDISVSELVENYIETNKVMVFSKTYCPYCDDAKELLQKLDVPFECIELDNDKQGHRIQEYLQSKTGQWTVPNIFINQEHIGGCDDLHHLYSQGKLKEILDM